jgi:hypothetical protein
MGFGELLPHFSLLRLGHVLPTAFDLARSQLPPHLRPDCRNISKPGWRSKNLKLISLTCRLERRPWISLRLEVDVILRDLLAGSLLNGRDLGPKIVNDGVLVADVCDVSRLVEENYVLRRRREVTAVTWPKPVAESDEDVGCRTDAEIRIAPVRDVEGISNSNAAFWR